MRQVNGSNKAKETSKTTDSRRLTKAKDQIMGRTSLTLTKPKFFTVYAFQFERNKISAAEVAVVGS
jgi:hypothetical protein